MPEADTTLVIEALGEIDNFPRSLNGASSSGVVDCD